MTALILAGVLALALAALLAGAIRRHDRRCNAPIDIAEYRKRVAAQAALARIHEGGKP